MAYSATKHQLTHLLQGAWRRLGALKSYVATAGSATTVQNTLWSGVEDAIFDDDDPALIYGTVVVLSAGGVAPEGKIGMITDYDAASQTLTFDTVGTAIDANDEFGIASPAFPFRDMMALANLALNHLGEIDVPDTSLTMVGGQTHYTLPSTIRKKPLRVRRQTVQNNVNMGWEVVNHWEVIPATAGGNWTLVVPDPTEGYLLEVLYRGLHPKLTDYDSDIIETIHPELSVCALVAEALQFYNNSIQGSNEYLLQRENKALQDLAAAKFSYPIQHFMEQVQGIPHWGKRAEYVPLTSDLRG